MGPAGGDFCSMLFNFIVCYTIVYKLCVSVFSKMIDFYIQSFSIMSRYIDVYQIYLELSTCFMFERYLSIGRGV